MIIGLCGLPTSGKSEISKVLVDKYGFDLLDTKKILRDITSTITGIESDSLKEQRSKSLRYNDLELRFIMGEVGLLLESLFGEDFLLQKALKGVDPSRNIVVDGLRRNQALFFNGVVLEVVSDRVKGNQYPFDKYNKEKVSYTINNSGTLEQLELKIDKFLKEYR